MNKLSQLLTVMTPAQIALALAVALLNNNGWFFISAFLYVLGLWQLDHLVAPHIWLLKGKQQEITPWHTMEITKFYVLCIAAMTTGYFAMVAAALI